MRQVTREMKNFDSFIPAHCGKRLWRAAAMTIAFAALGLTGGRTALAQAEHAADQGGARLSAGGTASGYVLGYGQIKILGGSAFIDGDLKHHIGFEGEARWLNLHWKLSDKGPGAKENAQTYLGGLRYFRHYGRFEPYAKGLVGIGQFNYPYGYAKETDFVIAPGGGFDYRLTNRIRWRAVDFEYQLWPYIHFGHMSSPGVSTGLKIKLY